MKYKLIEKEVDAYQFTITNLFELEELLKCKIDKTSPSLTQESQYLLKTTSGSNLNLFDKSYIILNPYDNKISVMNEAEFNNTYTSKL